MRACGRDKSPLWKLDRACAPLFVDGGEGGIRTLEGRESLPVFKTGAFNRSATSPAFFQQIRESGRKPVFSICAPLPDRAETERSKPVAIVGRPWRETRAAKQANRQARVVLKAALCFSTAHNAGFEIDW